VQACAPAPDLHGLFGNRPPRSPMTASHGNTPAAWTAVTIMFVGFLISGFALPLELPLLFFVGIGIVIVGAVTGKVMQMMGMGSPVSHDHDRDRQYDDNTNA
jgi:hypothetical protein